MKDPITKEVWLDRLFQALLPNPNTEIELGYNQSILEQIKFVQELYFS